jgi:hypothetical protein
MVAHHQGCQHQGGSALSVDGLVGRAVANLGGAAEFAAAAGEQRARIAASAKDLGIKATQ